ncbi:MAG: prepilin peptidase [Methanomicrobiaceae archaeon]|uniref:Signal peptidase, type iv-prepilin/preflagellin n=1 Tax=hydrocarbon metagenome TaxID=938273 RepID=A0A0W8FHU7_9ZZZZ|nr:prepilin peptidase [Methanomicrobiaceae archaeon]MDD5419669.1 A24 family peptidase C-terminal domain-containing protein [Methanomicrobiaceae archaeon]
MILPLAVIAVAIGITLIYASYRDIRERRVPHRTWRPALAVAVPLALWIYARAIVADWKVAAGYIILVLVFCGFFYLFQAMNLFGGADAYALIIITACLPFFPFQPLLGYPPLGFFPFTVLTNAVIINIAAPAGIFVRNILEGNRAPLPYLFLGFPVEGKSIQHTYGFVMEDITEEDGVLVRKFIGFRDSLRRMVRGGRRIYTKDLRMHPDEYRYELALYRRAGKVWLSYGIPFIIPITAGFAMALFMGDILYWITETLAGV